MDVSGFDQFCGGPFMNLTLLLDGPWPQFTDCFIHTILVWVPCGYVWLLLPYFLYDVNNQYSTNSLNTARRSSQQTGSSTPNHATSNKLSAVTSKASVANGNHHGYHHKSGSHTTNHHKSGSHKTNHPNEEKPVFYLSTLCATKMISTSLLALLSLSQLLVDIVHSRQASQLVASTLYLLTYALVVFQLWYERYKGRYPMFMSFYFYGMNFLLGIVPCYTWILTEGYMSNQGEFSILVVQELLNLFCFGLSFFSDNLVDTKKGDNTQMGSNPCPEVTASYPSKILFFWMMKLMVTGFKREIQADDIWSLNPRDQSCRLNLLYDKFWRQEQERVESINRIHFPGEKKGGQLRRSRASLSLPAHYSSTSERTSLLLSPDSITGAEVPPMDVELTRPSLTRVLLRLVWKNALMAIVQKLCADCCLYLGPFLLGILIDLLQGPEKVWQAYVVSFALFLAGTGKSFFFSQSMYRSCILGMHVKTVLVGAIYRKALTISSSARKGSTVGEIVNLMSVDCQRLQDILSTLLYIWTTPVQIIFAVTLLYYSIGPSVLTGVGLLVLLVPINTWVGSKQKLIQEQILKRKDERIKMVNEVLCGMKVLKLYAWEDQFKKKVEDIRQMEVTQLYKVAFLYVMSGLCWGITPFLVGLLTFATFVLSDRTNVLDPQKAFVSLALFNLLKVPLNYVSTIIIYTVQTSVSIKRINTFLVTDDLDTSITTWDHDSEHAISIQRGTFTWDRELQPTLRNINLEVPVGQLTAIVGPVGSGKSSLILSILGEMEKIQGQVTVKSRVAYVSQQAWIQNATVRDNILFGQRYHRQRYRQVVKLCELERDLQILEAGDQTEIGEKGINLSGGQKQRVNLARAVYSNADIFLFDDPLSAVDAHVGSSIFKNLIGKNGILDKKTRLLVTHGVHWLPQVDHVVVLSNGSVSEQGSYPQLVSHNGAFAQFLQMYLLQDQDQDNRTDSEEDEEVRKSKKAMRAALERVTSDTANTSADEFNFHKRPARSSISRDETRLKPLLTHESLDLSMASTMFEKSLYAEGGQLVTAEKLETGSVKRDVFLVYGRAAGLWSMATALLMFGLNQGFIVGSSFWLSKWTEDAFLLNATTRVSAEGAHKTDVYVIVYGVFFGLAQFSTFVLFNYLFWYRLVRAASRLHGLLLERLLHAPMAFFDQTPIGRILNRFSKDVDTVDNNLPLIMCDVIVTATIITFTIIVVLIKSPIFGAVLVPLIVLFLIIKNYYVRTSRQLKRIESIARSPVYVHFSESLTGAAVIRAYRATPRFTDTSDQRVDKNQVYFFASFAALRWLQQNMDMLANLVVLFAAVLQIVSGGGGSDAGLSVSYALQVSGSLPYMVRQICEFETNIVSVERMKEYSHVQQEAALVIPSNRPSPSWPTSGDVTFTNYQTRYREGLDLILKGVNCHIRGGEKVGIVGRTGAGKSSLTLCLFRIIEAVSGSINIDGVNIADIGLHDLRSKLTILPQDPVLFSGTLRMNIDPFDQYSDVQLWTALERSHLKSFVAGQPDRLLYECGEEGSNLSVGQRQLVCLARSLLRRTKILVLDEATAAIDMETDALIQATIREAFRDCTIIAIAHRLNTIMDYDRILVLDAGMIREFDTPQKLIEGKGVFYKMCRDAGLV
ncbi:ATP-binding cassette sub-family C member 2-like [Physella acuta]|uniref:ATP-binding cassette sub-family C member 2-like n=1 Tax=Physella acuta TaxID=109671 RepID=UPI0027DDA714|nr:ATP-binding cassette sub-family C member 2-like [Physella acuta]